MPNFIEKKYLDPKNANNKKKILPCNFNQEMLVTFGEKLLIFHIHKTKLIFALFAKNNSGWRKKYKTKPPLPKKVKWSVPNQVYNRHTRNNMSNHNIT